MFDVNISQRFDMSELRMGEYRGVCVNRVLSADELRAYERCGDGVYERVEVLMGEDMAIDTTRAMQADLFVINLGESGCVRSAVEIGPDMITMSFTRRMYCFSRCDVMEAIRRNIFFEICTVGSLYGRGDKMVWMGNVRRLLRATGGRNVVISSGARGPTEMKSAWDFLRILSVFGVDGGSGRAILTNSERLLRSCSLRRNPVAIGCVVSRCSPIGSETR